MENHHTSTAFWVKPRETQQFSLPAATVAWNDLMHTPSQLQ